MIKDTPGKLFSNSELKTTVLTLNKPTELNEKLVKSQSMHLEHSKGKKHSMLQGHISCDVKQYARKWIHA